MATTAAPAAFLTSLTHDELVRVLSETPANPWPTMEDRDAWERAAQTPHGSAIRDAALQAAEEHARTPGVRPPALSEFLAFARTGDRSVWERQAGLLSARLDAFTLAACFSGEAAWVERAADALWQICEMTTWTTPAHQGAAVPDPDFPTVDLYSAMRAQEIAETLQILGPDLDRIDARIARRARTELDRRVFDPFLARGDWWWLWKQPDRLRLNNWTAVCSGGVLLGALAALNDDGERQARIVARAAWSLGFFKDTFDHAGSLDEGAGYWAYGMSYYAMAGERLLARTNGRIDLLADPLWREVAQFPLRVNLYGDTCVGFSDIRGRVQTAPGWLFWLGKRLDVPGLVAWANRLARTTSARHLPSVLRTLFWMEDAALAPVPSSGEGTVARALSTYLPDVQWLIVRGDPSDDALVLAVKGGHNAENHNHNDGGSFEVHFRQEPLLADIGAPTYTRQFFSATRYENIAARSLGHSVPFVNGQEQQAGRAFAARVLDQGDSRLSLDLTGLYPSDAGLVLLRRDIALHRPGGGDAPAFLTLTDTATFSDDGASLALPLMTRDCRVEVSAPGRARVSGQRGWLDITWDPAQAACRAEPVPTDDPLFLTPDGETRLRRLWFDIAVNGREARLDLKLLPTK